MGQEACRLDLNDSHLAVPLAHLPQKGTGRMARIDDSSGFSSGGCGRTALTAHMAPPALAVYSREEITAELIRNN